MVQLKTILLLAAALVHATCADEIDLERDLRRQRVCKTKRCPDGEFCGPLNVRKNRRECIPRLAYGERCTKNDHCESDICNRRKKSCLCSANEQCGEGELCLGHVCVSSCAAVGCAEGLWCDEASDSCLPLKAVLEECSSDYECASSECAVLEPLVGRTDQVKQCLCTENEHCPEGDMCLSNGECGSKLMYNEECSRDEDCATSNCAIVGRREKRCQCNYFEGASTCPDTEANVCMEDNTCGLAAGQTCNAPIVQARILEDAVGAAAVTTCDTALICNGDGVCAKGQLFDTCEASIQCDEGLDCVNGKCLSKATEMCNEDEECVSRNCLDSGVCGCRRNIADCPNEDEYCVPAGEEGEYTCPKKQNGRGYCGLGAYACLSGKCYLEGEDRLCRCSVADGIECVDGSACHPLSGKCVEPLLGPSRCTERLGASLCASGECKEDSAGRSVCSCMTSDQCTEGHTCVEELCLPCKDNCDECSDVETCTACSQGYVLQGTECQETCDEGFFDKDGICTECTITGCEVCMDASVCKTCASGYWFTSSGDCSECGANCGQCTTPNFCSECSSGFVSQGGVCQPSCDEGFFDKDGICTECTIAGCEVCIDESTCDVCALGYYGNSGVCEECVSNCDTCASGTCTQCSSGFVLQGTECQETCDSGFSDEDGICTMSCTIAGCEVCQDQFSCNTCAPGYFPSSGRCFECDENCAICTSNTCTRCSPGYVLQGGVCQPSCDEGYGNFFSLGICEPCRPNCKVCSGPTSCSACYEGYVWDRINVACVVDPCSATPNCASCIPSGECRTCEEGFALIVGVGGGIMNEISCADSLGSNQAFVCQSSSDCPSGQCDTDTRSQTNPTNFGICVSNSA